PRPGTNDCAVRDEHHRFHQFDGAAGSDRRHLDVERVEVDLAEDVEADTTQHHSVGVFADAGALDRVDDEPTQWTKVLFVAAPRTTGMLRRHEPVCAEPFEIAVGDWCCGHYYYSSVRGSPQITGRR